MTFFGIDFSLTGTGLASFDGNEWDTATIVTTPENQSPGHFLDRVDTIASKALAWCDPREGDVIAIEGPALHAKSSQLDRMFGGWWLLFKALREHHGEPWVIPPTIVKQLATGKGGSSKEQVLIQAIRRIPAEIANNNEADAAWLAVAASEIGGAPAMKLPAAHLVGLTKMLAGGAAA